MPYVYQRTVHFQDTDAAGVVYFANVLAMCHEAYEASLVAAQIDLKTFFSGSKVAVPIAHASVDFLKPMFCGDRLEIALSSQQTTPSEFEVSYQIFNLDRKLLGKALTRHVCIDPVTRKRCDFPDGLMQWFELSVAKPNPLPADG